MTLVSARLTRAAVAASAAAALALAPVIGAGSADAHVVARTSGMGDKGFGVVTLMVPNESDAAATTGLTVRFPAVKHLLPEAKPGWTSKVTKDADGAVTEIRWTADPGTPGIPVGEFTEFNVSGGPFTGAVVLPAVQVYANGETVAWDQQAGPGKTAQPLPPGRTGIDTDTALDFSGTKRGGCLAGEGKHAASSSEEERKIHTMCVRSLLA